jgi:hypothetical protein
MTSSGVFRIRALAFLALGALVAIPGTTRGQERDGVPPVVARPENDLIEVEEVVDHLGAPRDKRLPQQVKLLMRFSQGDREQTRRRLEARLKSRIEQIDRACKLTEAQRHKLSVAGRGDIKRLFARIDEVKAKLADARQDVMMRQIAAQAAEGGELVDQTDCFGDGSLYSKVLKSTLTPEQVAVRDKAVKDASIAQHRATIRWAIGSMEPWLKLSPEQHEKLETLLGAGTKPPRKFGAYDYYGLMFQASKLPEKDFKSIFSDGQWQKVEQQIAEARRLEKTLRVGGFLPDDDVADAGKARPSGPVSEPVQPRC